MREPEAPTHSTPPLSFSVRFLFATCIPSLCSLICCFVIWNLYLRHTKAHRQVFGIFTANGPDSGGAGGIVFLALIAVAIMAAVFVILPTLFYSFRTAFRPWKTWYAAVAGGLAAQAIVPVVAVCVYAVVQLFLFFTQ